MKNKINTLKHRIILSSLIFALFSAGIVFAAGSASNKFDYLIDDGDTLIYKTSYSHSPATVLSEAGTDLSHAAYEVTEYADYTLISLSRSYEITVKCDGTEKTVTFSNGSVSDVLDSVGISLGEHDIISVSPDAYIDRDMVITISRVTFRCETVTSYIPIDVKYIECPYLELGAEKTVINGTKGELSTTYKYMYIDGALSETVIIDETVVKEPVSSLVSVGTRSGDYFRTYAEYSKMPEGVYSAESALNEELPENTVRAFNGELLQYSRVLNMKATAYTYSGNHMDITSSGLPVQVGVVAALSSTLPQGTRVYIVSANGTWEYGLAIVGDKPGRDIIDLFMETEEECYNFGIRNALVYVLD